MEEEVSSGHLELHPYGEIVMPQKQTFFTSASITKISLALVKAQGKMGSAIKDADNPFFHSKYADLGEVIRACKEALNTSGIACLQPIATGQDGKIIVTTLLLHESGEQLGSTVEFPMAKVDAQEFGKVVTYFKRYSLQALVLIPSEDDDGNTAVANADPQATNKPAPKKPAPKTTAGPREPCAPAFGNAAGQPLASLYDEQLEWYANVLNGSIDDPKKKNFKAKNEISLAAIIAELDVRKPPKTTEALPAHEDPQDGEGQGMFGGK